MTTWAAIVSRLGLARAPDDSAGKSPPGRLSRDQEEVSGSIGKKIAVVGTVIVGCGAAAMAFVCRALDAAAPPSMVVLAYIFVPILLIVSGAVGWWVIRDLTISIEDLRVSTAMIGHGNFAYRISEHRRDELGGLARSFNQMAARLGATTVSKEELQNAHDALARETAELGRANAEFDQFASVVSHDLQEPLRMITAYIKLLQKQYGGKLDKDAVEFIGYTVDGTKRMEALITGLLAYSRVGTRGKEFAPTDCNAVLARALFNLTAVLYESGARITHDPLPTVRGDERQLVQLFQNLLDNAIKYRGANPPEIHVGCQRDGDMWRFSVTDNGIGVNPEEAERIFVIFQRLHSRDDYSGTGVGLAICKKIVERHQGKIWLESGSQQGSTVFFILPRAEAGATDIVA